MQVALVCKNSAETQLRLDADALPVLSAALESLRGTTRVARSWPTSLSCWL